MRVLMIAACPLPWRRGTPIRIHRMAEALTRRGHDIDVATYPLGDSSFSNSYRIHRVAPHRFAMNPEPGPSWLKVVYLDQLLASRVRQLLVDGNFDVVHAHHYEGLITALRTAGNSCTGRRPIVYDAHTLLETELPEYRLGLPKWIAARLGGWVDRQLPPRADHIIAVTERMRARFDELLEIPPHGMSVISNGVEFDHFNRSGMIAPSAGGAPTVVFAGNLAEYQGVDLLLQAFKLVLREIPQARLSILTGSAPDAVMHRTVELGLQDAVSISDPDYDALPARIAQGHVLANPRVQADGVPQKLLNYMAVGRPIVSFAGTAAMLEHGRHALLAPDGDVSRFAHCIVKLISESQLAERLGHAAQQLAVTSSWDSIAAQVESVYCRVSEHRGIHRSSVSYQAPSD